jgi:hypothetical protein
MGADNGVAGCEHGRTQNLRRGWYCKVVNVVHNGRYGCGTAGEALRAVKFM